MPIDFERKCEYRVDYAEMYKEVNRQSFLDDKEMQKKYLEVWFKVLKDADKKITEQFRRPDIKAMFMKEMVEAPEIFQLPIFYSNATLYIHFRVTRYLQGLKKCNINRDKAQKIEISYFTKENSNIDWTKTSDRVDIKDEPILMVPFYAGKYHKFLVIDGNHRITDAVKKGKKEVEAYCIGEDFLVDNNFFSSEYDKLLYIFQNEIVTMGTYTIRDHISARNLMEQSYLVTRKTMKL